MTLLTRLLLAFVLLVGSALVLVAAEPPGPTGVRPFPGVVQCAGVHGIPLDGFEPAEGAEEARAGDRITVLFTIQAGPDTRQWLAEFRRAALTEREAKSKPGSGLGLFSAFLRSLKTDTGHEYSYAQTPVALEIRTFGPFADRVAAAAPETSGPAARVLATREYLAHGLAQLCEIELRLRAAGKKNPGLSYLFFPRYSDEQMTAAKARAAASGFTEDDERVYAEGFLALVQFAHLAFKTPGIAAITGEMVDSPSLFSGAFINPDWSGLQLEDGRNWGLPAARVFRLPYNFLSKTKARGTLFVTEPRPPLQNIAGLAGLTVDWSSKAPDQRLVMRVLAGRRGAP